MEEIRIRRLMLNIERTPENNLLHAFGNEPTERRVHVGSLLKVSLSSPQPYHAAQITLIHGFIVGQRSPSRLRDFATVFIEVVRAMRAKRERRPRCGGPPGA
jgi:hypothetical protein